MKAPLRRIEVWLVLVAGVALGALREFVFINLNYQLDHLARSTRWSYAHSAFQQLVGGMGLPALMRLKWALAALFIAVNAGLVVLLSRMLSGTGGRTRTILIAYLALGILAFLLEQASRTLPPLGRIAVQLLHLLQYPVPIVLLLAYHQGLYRRSPLPR